MNIGKVYDILKKERQSTQVYLKALAIFQEVGDREGQATILNHLGVSCRKNRKIGQRHGNIMRRHCESFKNRRPQQEAITLQHLGRFSFFQELENDATFKRAFREAASILPGRFRQEIREN